MMSLLIQATWLRGDIRSKLSGISKAKIKFIELSENDSIDAKEDGEDLKTLLFEYGFRLPIFEIVERRDQYQGYGSKMYLLVQLLKVIINKQIGPQMCNFYQRSHQQFKDQIE